jgi:hypothetical protein
VARCSKVWCGCVEQLAYCIVGTQTASAIMIGLHELMSHTVHECLVQGVYVLYCTRVFGAECHIQFKSDSTGCSCYVQLNCLIHGVYVMYCTRVFSVEFICHIQLKGD